jgi:hypothetical protein
MMDLSSQEQHLFVVRIWQEPGHTALAQWRGSVEHIPSGQRLYFSSLRDLNDFIFLRLGFAPAQPDEGREK